VIQHGGARSGRGREAAHQGLAQVKLRWKLGSLSPAVERLQDVVEDATGRVGVSKGGWATLITHPEGTLARSVMACPLKALIISYTPLMLQISTRELSHTAHAHHITHSLVAPPYSHTRLPHG
jgi:hypothetical protein